LDVFTAPLALEPSFAASLALHMKEAIRLEMKNLQTKRTR
jgi:hypothetical protein